MAEKRRFEKIYNIIEVNSYRRYEEIHKNKEMFVYGFKHIEKKLDNHTLIGCESDELYENDDLLNFWSNNFF